MSPNSGVFIFDRAVCIRPPRSREDQLCAAIGAGSDAIHPGGDIQAHPAELSSA